MARLPRFDLAGHLHLVVQRARVARPPFVDDQDRRRYLSAMLDASRQHDLGVHAYALLNDTVLLLATPARAGGLASFMQSVGRQYVKAFNHRHGRSGALWEGRYRATVVEAAARLIACIRFVEQAPVRERLVPRLGDWPWSSAAHHLGLKIDGIVSEHAAYWQLGNTPFEREARYGRESAIVLDDAEATSFLSAAWHGWPVGSDAYVEEVANLSGRPARPRLKGRPARK